MENLETDQPPVDFSRIQETSEGDLEFESDLFSIYLEDCQLRLDKLRAAIDGGDTEAVHLEAHTIKGASANVGTTLLHEIAFALEQADSTQISESGANILGQLEAEFGRVRESIQTYLNQL